MVNHWVDCCIISCFPHIHMLGTIVWHVIVHLGWPITNQSIGPCQWLSLCIALGFMLLFVLHALAKKNTQFDCWAVVLIY